ncbi:MAG: hypothetical protein M1821_006901 [Bathelium mastoideum]|nr:MAG: hypothetical protein M1821_006901 [Bathelium mastoideum]KAI9687641.1 MAG: hypothetical protein M1822_002251 [Bathelium mastoideum]
MPAASTRRKAKSLSHGRPPLLQKPSPTLSAKATRKFIQRHHQLEKAHALALRDGDVSTAKKLAAEIEAKGGLQVYQAASILGQSESRGGDSSRVLVQWLEELRGPQTCTEPPSSDSSHISPCTANALALLEIGSLTPHTHSARSPLFARGATITRIDLHAQHPSIAQQDFMQRPLPTRDTERFDVLSLSLVLNFVPEAEERGRMLARTRAFLRQRVGEEGGRGDGGKGYMYERGLERVFPCLFVVLPAPCVINSRYLTEERLGEMMAELGFALARRKRSAKLVYYLWSFKGASDGEEKVKMFGKKAINPGRARNNFCIALK